MNRGFCWGDVRERDHLEDSGVDGTIILKWIIKGGVGSMDWIDLAQIKSIWRAVVNAVMNLRIS